MTATIDLTPEQRDTVLQLLARHLPNTEAWAYGSRVKWTSRPQSDLDMVVFAKPQQARAVSDLREAYEESNLPFRVALFVWDEVPEAFREQIEREYVVMVSEATENLTERSSKTLGDVADIVMGQSPSGNTVSAHEGIPLLNGPKEFGSHHPAPVQRTIDPKKYCQSGDILFCVRGSTGRMNWADQQYAIGRGIAAIRHKHHCALQPLVRAVIEFALPDLLVQATGSVFSNVSASQLATIPYPGFDGREQRAIAHILGTLDDKIELNRRMNQTLEAMARALFKSWFIDFDPVRAKMALKQHAAQRSHSPLEGESAGQGRSPQSLRWGDAEAMGPGAPHPPTESAFAFGSTSSTPPQGGSDWTVERARAYLDNMDEEITALFPDRLVNSELGEIPEGWEVSTLGEISDKPQYGYTASAKTEPIGPQFLRITDINKEPWITWSRVPYCKTTDKDLSKYRIKQGDVLIARMADPGHGILIEEDVEAVFASYLIRFRPNNSHHARILQYWLKSDTYWQMVKSRGSGTTRVSLNAQTLGGFPLVVPSNFVAKAFTTVISGFRNRLVTNAKEMQVLISLRDALLPKLISGEIRLSDAGKWVEEAV